MFLRNNKSKIVVVDTERFLNEKEFYIHLWKTIFDIDMSKQDISFNETLIKYIKGSILLI